jgi:shikimate kinase
MNDYSNVNLPALREKDHKHFFGEDYDEEFDIVICNGGQVNNNNADLESLSKEHHIIFINDELDNV